MPNFDEHLRQALVKRIRGTLNEHRTIDCGDDAPVACSCGALGLSDHPRHVAEQIVDGLDLRVDAVDHIKKRIRYASAWFDWELTQLEGAEF